MPFTQPHRAKYVNRKPATAHTARELPSPPNGDGTYLIQTKSRTPSSIPPTGAATAAYRLMITSVSLGTRRARQIGLRTGITGPAISRKTEGAPGRRG
jgi:hypothetical protein